MRYLGMSEDDSLPPGADGKVQDTDVANLFPVVAIGASAGGLEALTHLLRALPADTGMAFVILQHLSPGKESSLPAILSRETQMPVTSVAEDVSVKSDCVYVMPPGRDMIINGGRLLLQVQERTASQHGIDKFFRSLAEDRGHMAIGVVLSGCASDGTLGLEEISAAGGCTFAQDESAHNKSMPESAVASGCVDFVLPPEGIAQELARIARHPHVTVRGEITEPEPPDYSRIIETVRQAKGVDFIHYKPNTLHRRITRRMMLHRQESPSEYEDFLRRTPDEVEALYDDILIGVTRFFRDPDAFQALAREVFPKIIAECAEGGDARLWAIACATGEEAYSLAILFTECAEAVGSRARLQLFATDVNAAAIERARAGRYSRNIEQDVSPERLRRFFTSEREGYRISKAIRERCIFSQHNILADPPFSNVDFISCRNLLIYMKPTLQQHVMPLFHYALKPGGWLWLGSSESVGEARDRFDVLDARHKIYTRKPGGRQASPRSRQALRSFIPMGAADRQLAPERGLHRDAERLLLTKYAPPGVIVSTSLEIVQFQGDTSRYLSFPSGTASMDLMKMLRNGLSTAVREAIRHSEAEGSIVRTKDLQIVTDDGTLSLAVEVIPVKSTTSGSSGGFAVLFHEAQKSARVAKGQSQLASLWARFGKSKHPATGSKEEEVTRLSEELVATRESLQSVIDQHEATNKELQTSNEEAQSSNEEMQSINEELETTKEEIEASNEELATLNDELNSRNADLGRVNDELQKALEFSESIVSSVRSPLLVLDQTLRVQMASESFYECFLTTSEDTEGRYIYDLGNGQWNIPALRRLLEEVLPKNSVIEDFEVSHIFEKLGLRIMLLNAFRLKHSDKDAPRIILSFEDVTMRRELAEGRLQNEQLFSRIIDQAPGAVFVLDSGLRFQQLNPQTVAVFGHLEPLIGRRFAEVMDILWGVEVSARIMEIFANTLRTGERFISPPFTETRQDVGGQQSYDWEIQRVTLPNGEYGVVCYFTDTTEKKKLESTLIAHAAELARADRSKDEFLAMLAHELRNPLAPLSNAAEILRMTGANADEKEHAQAIITRQIENMSRMIDDLLDVSRITEGKIQLRKQPVALETILTSATSLVRSTCASHH